MTGKIPATIITGFLGAGKTSLLRHVMASVSGRADAPRLAIIVNEFGTLGIDGDLLRNCALPGCTEEDDIIELANGCLCCTVAEDFLPAMAALLARDPPPTHIIIETSGLALPKPLLKAFAWPDMRARVTVDGVIAVLDAPAIADGRFADSPEAVAAQTSADAALDHENPLAEVYEDQLHAADLVVLNKTDLLAPDQVAAVSAGILGALPRGVRLLPAVGGAVDPAILLALGAAAEDDLAARPSHHDALDGAHEHDDFTSFVLDLPEFAAPQALLDGLARAIAAHAILRIKGFVAIAGRPMRLLVQGVGGRLRHEYDRDWHSQEPRAGRLVIIGLAGLDQPAIRAAILG